MARALFRVEVLGRENMPPAGAIVAGVPHRNWSEPLLLVALLPARPRMSFIADGRTVDSSAWRRLAARSFGGVIPARPGRGAAGFEGIAAAIRVAVTAGSVVAIFPEVGTPSRAPSLRRVSPGVAHLSARSGALVVPVVFGGTHELYLRRRIVVRLLPPIAPPVGTDRGAIDSWMAGFQAAVESTAIKAHSAAESGAPSRKRWRWLTGNFPRA